MVTAMDGGTAGYADGSSGCALEESLEPPPKPTKISLQLALRSSLAKADLGDYDKLSAEEVYEKASRLTTLHLEWQQIGEIASLEPFENAEILYLQYNRIERIEGLDFMPKLQFLALQGNRIELVENLFELTALEFLDLSANKISSLNVAELPKSIAILNLKDNPCAKAFDHQERLQAHLPDLAYLDGRQLHPDEPGAESESLGPSALAGTETELQLDASDKGMSAYYRKDGLQLGLATNIEEQIQAYGTESLADTDGFGQRIEAAVKRSEKRRENVEEQLSAVKRGLGQAMAAQEEALAKASKRAAEELELKQMCAKVAQARAAQASNPQEEM